MKNLTQHQLNFMLDKFFHNEEYPGWKEVATNLLQTGKCIVAGDKCIWTGGIGNFIKTTKAEGAVGCLEYTFHRDYFLASAMYKETFHHFISNREQEINRMVDEYNDIVKMSNVNTPLFQLKK